MKKVLSMSVYGNNPRYYVGARRQIDLAKEFYPDFRVRVYVDEQNHDRLIGRGADIIVCPKTDNGVFWRFLPMWEPDTITMVRDADGRITEREAQAVNQFLKTNLTFHTFRDHEAHYDWPVIACAFMLRGQLSPQHRTIMEKFMERPFFYTNDQVFLRDYVWPSVEKDSLVHHMKEGWFGESRSLLKNRFDFCGNGWDENDMPLYPPTMQEMAGYSVSNLPETVKFNKGAMWE